MSNDFRGSQLISFDLAIFQADNYAEINANLYLPFMA